MTNPAQRSGWFADRDSDSDWQPCLQLPSGAIATLDMWFGSEESCVRFIHDEVLHQPLMGPPSGAPRIQHLDFSEFHPLDHWVGSAYCRTLPGGWRNHLDLAWTYRWSRQLASVTWCRLGRHHWCEAWTHEEPSRSLCANCGKLGPVE